jgi:ATP-binding cassette subfamily F protein uup
MALITLSNAQLAYGHVALLDHTDFSLEEGERVGIIGRNGAGKSSMLKILAGIETPDDGNLTIQQGVRIAYVPQEPVFNEGATTFEAACAGVANVIALIDEFSTGEGDLEKIQSQIESQDGWNWQQRVEETLERLQLGKDELVSSLSGGTKKRLALAQALVQRPDVLFLDEPTNHLDLYSIEWLENLLLAFNGSVVMITHDRSFLNKVATRIVDLDRGKLLSYPGNFEQYVIQKAEQLAQEAIINAKADKLLSQEEVWIRKGVEARRTRSESRITRLEGLRANRESRREVVGRVQMDVASAQTSGKIVAELENVNKSFGDQVIVKNFTGTVLRGDKIGLIGPNGAGKTTLLKMILGELAPDSGTVKLGTKMDVAYFDQMRANMDPDATLEDFISPGSEWIEIGNQRKHVKSYLADFLFAAARARSPIKSLSGGERNRLLLARLFARPANVLVLDEPTNDLDMDTLELLEDLLQQFEGTVFLVSHDRTFLDNVVTSTLVFEGNGQWREFEGGVQDWLTQSQRNGKLLVPPVTFGVKATPVSNTQSTPSENKSMANSSDTASVAVKKKKLSYKDQRDLDELPAKIEALEKEQANIQKQLADGSLYVSDAGKAQQLNLRHAEIDDLLISALERWEMLSAS